jgi:hypothetical protein
VTDPDLVGLFVAPLERLGLDYMITGGVAGCPILRPVGRPFSSPVTLAHAPFRPEVLGSSLSVLVSLAGTGSALRALGGR